MCLCNINKDKNKIKITSKKYLKIFNEIFISKFTLYNKLYINLFRRICYWNDISNNINLWNTDYTTNEVFKNEFATYLITKVYLITDFLKFSTANQTIQLSILKNNLMLRWIIEKISFHYRQRELIFTNIICLKSI